MWPLWKGSKRGKSWICGDSKGCNLFYLTPIDMALLPEIITPSLSPAVPNTSILPILFPSYLPLSVSSLPRSPLNSTSPPQGRTSEDAGTQQTQYVRPQERADKIQMLITTNQSHRFRYQLFTHNSVFAHNFFPNIVHKYFLLHMNGNIPHKYFYCTKICNIAHK